MSTLLSISNSYVPGVVALGGSRVLSRPGCALVAQLAALLASSGHGVSVGCCRGADATAIGALTGSPALHVCAVFDRHGFGAWSASAVNTTRLAAIRGSRVSWLAGGPRTVPLVARLTRRTAAVADACTCGAAVFFQGPGSRGSQLLARLVAAKGLPVVAFAVGFPPSQLPALGPGEWLPMGSFPGATAALWGPHQRRLFSVTAS